MLATRSFSLSALTCLSLAGTAIAQHALLTIDGASGSRLGATVAVLGDLDGDRHPDFAAKQDGAIAVYSGTDGRLIRRIAMPASFDFGTGALAGPGDVNKDGFVDLVAGNVNDGSNGEGTVSVFSGAWILNGTTPRTLHRWVGANGDKLGGTVNGTDLDGDGYADVITLAPQANSGLGYIRAYSGRTGVALFTRNGTTTSPFQRFYILGDVNKDGVTDLLAHGSQPPPVVALSGKDGRRILRLTRSFGRGVEVGLAGDNNRDGYPDFIVAVPRARPHQVHVFSGKDASLLRTFQNLPTRTGFGPKSVGDIDGDQVDDVLLNQTFTAGATPRIYSGRTLQQIVQFGRFWWVAAAAGDVDLDGVPDVLVGHYLENNSAGQVAVLSGKKLTFQADRNTLPVAQGGTVRFSIDAPAAAPGGSFYFVLGSATGTWPGFRFGGVRIPLNVDPYLDVTLGFPNVWIQNSWGALGTTAARYSASLTVPAGLPPSLAGESVHHACVVIDRASLQVRMVSNTFSLLLE